MHGEHKQGNEGGRGEKGEGERGEAEDGCRSAPSDNTVLLVVGRAGGAEGRNVSSQHAGVVTSECPTNKLLTLTNMSAARELFLNLHNVADSRRVTGHKHSFKLPV